jgi:hypothetical protein
MFSLKNYNAVIKRLDILADVFEVNKKGKYILWFDNQYSRSIPPDKYYETESFNNIDLYKKIKHTNTWEKVELPFDELAAEIDKVKDNS